VNILKLKILSLISNNNIPVCLCCVVWLEKFTKGSDGDSENDDRIANADVTDFSTPAHSSDMQQDLALPLN